MLKTKLRPRWAQDYKASIHTGGPRDFLLPVLSRLKCFGVDLRRYVDPRPEQVTGIIAFPEAKTISMI